MARTNVLTVRVSEDEHEAAGAGAAATGISLGEFLRHILREDARSSSSAAIPARARRSDRVARTCEIPVRLSDLEIGLARARAAARGAADLSEYVRALLLRESRRVVPPRR